MTIWTLALVESVDSEVLHLAAAHHAWVKAQRLRLVQILQPVKKLLKSSRAKGPPAEPASEDALLRLTACVHTIGDFEGQCQSVVLLMKRCPYETAIHVLDRHYLVNASDWGWNNSRTYRWLGSTSAFWKGTVRENWAEFTRRFPMWDTAILSLREEGERAAQLALLYEATRLLYYENTEQAIKDFDTAIKQGVIDDPTRRPGWDDGMEEHDIQLAQGPAGSLSFWNDVVERKFEQLRGSLLIFDDVWTQSDLFETLRAQGMVFCPGEIFGRKNAVVPINEIEERTLNYIFRRSILQERREWKDRRNGRIEELLQQTNWETDKARTDRMGELRRDPTQIPDFYSGSWNYHRFRDRENPIFFESNRRAEMTNHQSRPRHIRWGVGGVEPMTFFIELRAPGVPSLI